MIFRVVIWILLNKNLLNEAKLTDLPVIFFVRIDKCSSNAHHELINLKTESLCYFDSQVTYSLEDANLNLLLYQFWSHCDSHLRLLKVTVLLFRLLFQSLFSFIAIKKL